MRIAALGLFTGLLTLLAEVPAQVPAAPQAPKRFLIDAVVATVNDTAILLSDLRTKVVGRIRAEEARLGRLGAQEIELITQRQLKELIDRGRMAQAAKTFGTFSPEQVESMLRSQLDRDKQEMVRDFGTHTEFSRELQRQGRDWPTYERAQRTEKLWQFAQDFSVNRRLARQTNLFLTPLMLRQTYAVNKDRFIRTALAVVSIVTFHGPDAKAQADQAAAIWRQDRISSRELAKRFPGATPLEDLPASAALVPELSQFALAGPEGAVSAPLAIQGAVQLAKVTRFQAARNGRFEDPDVQEELRDLCRQQVVIEFTQQAQERARDRTEVWTSPHYR